MGPVVRLAEASRERPSTVTLQLGGPWAASPGCSHDAGRGRALAISRVFMELAQSVPLRGLFGGLLWLTPACPTHPSVPCLLGFSS